MVRTSVLDSRRQRGQMNHQSHRLPRPILCQPCPKHFPPINSHTSHGCSGKSTASIPVLQMRKPRGRSGSHSFRVMQQRTWDLNPEPMLLATRFCCPLPTQLTNQHPVLSPQPPHPINSILWPESLLLSSPKSCPGSGKGVSASRISNPASGVIFLEHQSVSSLLKRLPWLPTTFKIKSKFPWPQPIFDHLGPHTLPYHLSPLLALACSYHLSFLPSAG